MRQHRKGKLLMAVGLAVVMGCASQTKTVRTETDIYRPGEPTVVQKETTVTEHADAGSRSGLLSGTVNLVGEVLALPFRVVGGLIRLIF